MQLLLVALSTVCAGLPMMGFLAVVWWLDRYDREPVALVASAFAWGALGAVPVAMVASAILLVPAVAAAALLGAQQDAHTVASVVSAVFVAPLAEEPSKALILIPIALSRHFDNMTDGFVYGAAAGLGFGMTENFLYFVSVSADVETWVGTVLIRTFYSAMMHATATAAIGAGLGWGRFRGPGHTAAAGLVGMAVGMAIHLLWNGLITVDQLTTSRAAWQADLTLIPVLVLAMLAVFEVCLLEETRTIRVELDAEARDGVLPSTHPRILASWWRRMGWNWAPRTLDKQAYIAAATSLAMRKHQSRLMGKATPQWVQADIALLRQKIRRLLAEAPVSAPD